MTQTTIEGLPCCMHVDSNTQYTSKWINMIEDTLNRTGLGGIWFIDGSLHNTECIKDRLQLKGHCIEFKYYADGIHSGLTPPGNNS